VPVRFDNTLFDFNEYNLLILDDDADDDDEEEVLAVISVDM